MYVQVYTIYIKNARIYIYIYVKYAKVNNCLFKKKYKNNPLQINSDFKWISTHL